MRDVIVVAVRIFAHTFAAAPRDQTWIFRDAFVQHTLQAANNAHRSPPLSVLPARQRALTAVCA
jgi:hypothetical protein